MLETYLLLVPLRHEDLVNDWIASEKGHPVALVTQNMVGSGLVFNFKNAYFSLVPKINCTDSA